MCFMGVGSRGQGCGFGLSWEDGRGRRGFGWWKDLGGVMGAENGYPCPQMDEDGCVEVQRRLPG
jgi:hypothetical protein